MKKVFFRMTTVASLLEIKNIDAPPAKGTTLKVQFFGRPGFVPIGTESDPNLFEIDGKLILDVRPTLSDRNVSVRVKYSGTRLPWKPAFWRSVAETVAATGQTGQDQCRTRGEVC